jgi:hypothetical protein
MERVGRPRSPVSGPGRTLVLALVGLLLAASSPAQAERFKFVALGDTAYNLPGDLPKWHALITAINRAHPAFSIHVGDIWGREECTDENYLRVKGEFATFEAPLIYTPGDNEWVDCIPLAYYAALERAGAQQETTADTALLADTFANRFAGVVRDDGPARLADLRRTFFPAAESLGAHPMPLTRQADISEFRQSVENARWRHGGVLFATVHVVGSMDDQFATDPDRLLEARERLMANVAWIRETFEEAERREDKAVVLAMQAALFTDGEPTKGFNAALMGGRDSNLYWIAQAIREYGTRWGKPVLLINGDFHEFIVDQPFRVLGPKGVVSGGNITRLQVFGSPDLRSVSVTVDTDAPWVFGFEPLW